MGGRSLRHRAWRIGLGTAGTVLMPGIGTAAGIVAGNQLDHSKWSLDRKKKKSDGGSGGTAAGSAVETGTTVGGDDMGSVAGAFDSGALSEAKARRKAGAVMEGPETFTGGYGTIGG